MSGLSERFRLPSEGDATVRLAGQRVVSLRNRRGTGSVSIDCSEAEPEQLDWAMWPEREDLSLEYLRLMGSAQEGGATAAECRVTAGRIDPMSDHSWYTEWMGIADVNCRRGNAAQRDSHLLTARSNWLRAINYYQAAALPFDREDRHYWFATSNMRQCARDYLDCCSPRGEVVRIPWLDGYPLEAYFLPAPKSASLAPVVVCIGEPGQRKEEFLHKVARHARERGVSLLAADLLGAGTGVEFDAIVGRSDLESALGAIMDHLVERDDVDAGRIAVLADGWGSSFVARGIAFDDRVAAAVCDGGIWDLHERDFLAARSPFQPSFALSGRDFGRVARNIQCPVLIATGERGWLKAERVRELFSQLKEEGGDVTLRIFSVSETAAMQAHVDNPTLANEFIFDWIASTLGV